MDNVNDKDLIKKKKRRKRKKSTTVVKQNIEKVEKDRIFDTMLLEKIREQVDKDIDNKKEVPMHIFTIKNLFVTVLATCLVVLVIVAGYLVGLFEDLRSEPLPSIEFELANNIELQKKYIDVDGYKFLIPDGYQLMDSDNVLKVSNFEKGNSIELLEISKSKNLLDPDVITELKNELIKFGYAIYGTYFTTDYANNFLVFSGVDVSGLEMKMVYVALNDKKNAKIMISSEYGELSNESLDSVDELLNR